ncbi:MAG: hypothetical protein OJF49_004671 [Ktedonobacterales bacterium]|nr:MAG: hypothetical protein OJF49_004671 [Ktedonobacterales bacterium]
MHVARHSPAPLHHANQERYIGAYAPTLGRFLSRDPLGRAPLMWASQPYVYAGNNPLVNVDPCLAFRH